jgi:hypothetical protein
MPQKMNIEQVAWWRKLVGTVGTVFCILFFISAGDAIVSQTRQPLNLIELLPGSSEKFNFSLSEKIETINELSHQSSSELIRVFVESLHKGFWFGGYMCGGSISADPSISQGDYVVKIFSKKNPKPLYEFKVIVYRNADDYRLHSKSVIYRHSGISPWVAMLICPLFVLAAAGLIFYLSRKWEYLLALSGKAEIYQASRKDGYYEISFGLGKQQGTEIGMHFNVYDQEGTAIGSAKVTAVSESDSSAEISAYYVRPGYIVSKC